MDKIKQPKVDIEPIEPVEVETIRALANSCNKMTFHGRRDRAILLSLLDTGARAQEFLDLDLQDVNLLTGTILIRRGKNRAPRTVFIGKSSRKSLRAYLKHRQDDNPALWINRDGERLKFDGLRS